MTIQPAGARPLDDVLLAVDPGDMQAMAIAVALKDAKESRKQARQSRDAAYDDRIHTLRQTAEKMRTIATNALVSGVLQGSYGAVSAGLSIGGDINSLKSSDLTSKLKDAEKAAKAGKAPTQIRVGNEVFEDLSALRKAEKASRQLTTGLRSGARTADALGKFNIAQMTNPRLEAEKQELQTRAEVLGKKADMAGDLIQESARLQRSLLHQLEKLSDLRQAAMTAAVR